MNNKVLKQLRQCAHHLRIRILGKNAEEQVGEQLIDLLPGVSPQEKARAIVATLQEADDIKRRYEAYKNGTEALFAGGCPAITKALLDRYGPDDSLWRLLEEKGAVKPGHSHSELGVLEARSYFKSSQAVSSVIDEVTRARLSSLARLEAYAEERYSQAFTAREENGVHERSQ